MLRERTRRPYQAVSSLARVQKQHSLSTPPVEIQRTVRDAGMCVGVSDSRRVANIRMVNRGLEEDYDDGK